MPLSASCVFLCWIATRWCRTEISQTISIQVWLQPSSIHLHRKWLKNHRGGSNKVVTTYSTLVGDSGDPLRDVVYLLDYNFSKFPEPLLSMDFMYLQPKPQVPADPKEPCFYPNLIGKNTVHSSLHTLCEEAGIEDKKSDIWYLKTSRAFVVPIHSRVLLAAIPSWLVAL